MVAAVVVEDEDMLRLRGEEALLRVGRPVVLVVTGGSLVVPKVAAEVVEQEAEGVVEEEEQAMPGA